jgi:hypothetical protein
MLVFPQLLNVCCEKQTTQWPKEKVQKNKQQNTQHTHQTKDRVTRTPLKARRKRA